MSSQLENFIEAFMEEVSGNGRTARRSEPSNVLEEIASELKRLNENLESTNSLDGPGQNIDAFLEEYNELRDRYDENPFTHTDTDSAMNDAADAAREVRVQRTVKGEHLSALSDLRRNLNS